MRIITFKEWIKSEYTLYRKYHDQTEVFFSSVSSVENISTFTLLPYLNGSLILVQDVLQTYSKRFAWI